MRLSQLLFRHSNHIEYYSKFQPTPFTLQSLIDFGLSRKQKNIFINNKSYF
jgi:hypothetical protein